LTNGGQNRGTDDSTWGRPLICDGGSLRRRRTGSYTAVHKVRPSHPKWDQRARAKPRPATGEADLPAHTRLDRNWRWDPTPKHSVEGNSTGTESWRRDRARPVGCKPNRLREINAGGSFCWTDRPAPTEEYQGWRLRKPNRSAGHRIRLRARARTEISNEKHRDDLSTDLPETDSRVTTPRNVKRARRR
jgi:hypothetical protein